MVLLVGVSVQTLETLPLFIALFAKEEVVAILAHPAAFEDRFFAVETLEFLLLAEERLKHNLELMPLPMGFRKIALVLSWPLKEAFLTYFISKLQSLKFLQDVQEKQTPKIGF